MEHFYQNLGEDWFTFPKLYSHVASTFADGSRFVEVGSWKGRSASYLAVEIINAGKDIKLFCVDTWQGSVEHESMACVKDDTLYKEFIINTEPVKDVIVPIRKASIDAAKTFADGSLSFVFIDASHVYEDVMQDLEAWYPKVAAGGIFAGHDYSWDANVARAVFDWSKKNNVEIRETDEGCWITYK